MGPEPPPTPSPAAATETLLGILAEAERPRTMPENQEVPPAAACGGAEIVDGVEGFMVLEFSIEIIQIIHLHFFTTERLTLSKFPLFELFPIVF